MAIDVLEVDDLEDVKTLDETTDLLDQPIHSTSEFRHIPKSVLNDETLRDIQTYLDEQLSLADAERQDYIDNMVRWHEAYEAKRAESPKDFPLKNSSNITVPVIKEVANTIAAQLVVTTLTAKPPWILDALAPEWEPFVSDIERFLALSAERDLNLDEITVAWIIEAVKLGTSIMEIGHEVTTRNVVTVSEDGHSVEKRQIVIQDGPVAMNVPLQNFWIRLHETNIQTAAWVSKLLYYTENELLRKKSSGKFENVDEVIIPGSTTHESPDDVLDKREELEDTEPIDRPLYRVHEIWLSWDIDDDGELEELLLYYEPERRIFLGKFFNPYWHGKRPFVKLVYFPREHRFYGDGVCSMLEAMQEEISTTHNQRIDNATLANLKMIIKRKMMRGLMPGDPLHSGKIIEANDIFNDIREFTLSEIYPSTVTNEQITRGYVERLSGVSEPRGTPVTRTTATAQALLLQEQAKKFDLSVRGIRAGLNEVGALLLALHFQFGTKGKSVAWLGERGKAVDAIFSLPARIIDIGVAVRVGVPTSQVNEEMKRQNSIQLFNLLVQMYKEFIAMTAQLAPQALGEVANALVKSAKKFMRQTLETFGDPDPEGILAGLTVLERVLPAPEDFGGLDSFERAEATAKVLDQVAGVEDLLRQAQAAERGAARLPLSRRDSGRNIRPEESASDTRLRDLFTS